MRLLGHGAIALSPLPLAMPILLQNAQSVDLHESEREANFLLKSQLL
ncbi:hypothetical protein [Leptolyngbya sp. FACHB-541]|nr:hypothetical protein [Leptolyngbya sp. FACHB-541]